MSAWHKAPLSIVCSLVTDGTHHSPPNHSTGTYRYVTAKNIRPWGLDLSDISYVDEAIHREIYSRCPVEFDDILYIKDGVTTGLAAINTLKEPFSLLSSVALLKPIREVLHPRYLKHWLNSPDTKREMTSGMTGTAIKRLVLKQIRAAEIPVAPLQEQQRIADKLDTVLARVDAVNDRLARVAPLLKRFRQAVLAAATSGRLTADWRDDLAEGDWRAVSLRDVADDFSYGSAAKSSPTGCIPVLRMGNIQGGQLDWSELVYTNDPHEISRYALRSGDVLFNRTNSPELVGKTAVFKGERDAIYAGYLIRVRCSDQLLPDFLNFCLGSPRGRDYCWAVKSDGVSQSNINAKKLAAFSFELPSLAEQSEIVRRVDILFTFADRLEARLQAAQTAAGRLTPALLAKAFRGELVPQDPADEPAAELLRRLSDARTAESPTKRRASKGSK